jgi:CheY-like chemotaxis protein
MPGNDQPNVLLVEDESLDRRILTGVLQKHDANVAVATRAFEAVSHIEKGLAAKSGLRLVLLDWKLPGGGASVLRAVRDSPALQLTPVVVLSRSQADVDVLAAYRAGANAFVGKPPDLDAFERRLTAICDFWLCAAIVPVPPAGALV